MPSYTAPAYGYGYCAPTCQNNDFILIVVLFILLIIVGASFYCGSKC
ncbi:YjcZ family sporulation protein [Niallia endozanthoxylica]|uniref:YjcZ family sporulation protein n=1 Tax=Niallia endozanthoxylica TaxID=2036016 RepID=A0A5J5I039_9BACI|nr:YjcZ family sporulation protein [Niallia endozanthoxylica]